jgi:hypothetical protein
VPGAVPSLRRDTGQQAACILQDRRAYDALMVTNPLQPDPIDEELARLLADPELRARSEDFEERFKRRGLKTIPHAEVRRRLGLDPSEADQPSSDA